MPITEKPWVSLLKFPVTVFSILIALWIARYALGIQFGAVAEVGPGGVRFARDTVAEITDLSSRLNGALAAIEELRKTLPAPVVKSAEAQATVFEASQTVSDQTARLASLAKGPASEGGATSGYIWIGDFRQAWSRVKLGDADQGKPVSTPPADLLPGTEFKVLGNMVVRDGLPSNDAQYFQGRKSLGTLPRGTKVRLVEKPVPIDRGGLVQVWAKVELP